MPDEPAAEGPEPRPLRTERYFTEAELAAAAERARLRHKLTQAQLAARLGVQQHTVSAALDYGSNSTRGHAIRRRILRDLDGLHIAGPYWLPVEPGKTPPGLDPHVLLPLAGVAKPKAGGS